MPEFTQRAGLVNRGAIKIMVNACSAREIKANIPTSATYPKHSRSHSQNRATSVPPKGNVYMQMRDLLGTFLHRWTSSLTSNRDKVDLPLMTQPAGVRGLTA